MGKAKATPGKKFEGPAADEAGQMTDGAYEERIAKGSQEAFDLDEVITGIKPRQRPGFLIFTDVDAVDAYAAKQHESAIVDAQLANPALKHESDRAAELRKRSAELGDEGGEVDQAREEMLKGALSLHLVALGSKVNKVIASKVSRKYRDENTGKVPADRIEECFDEIAAESLVRMTYEIRRADGSKGRFRDAEQTAALLDTLPSSQEKSLRDAMDALNYEDDIAKAAILDPGF